MHGNTLSSVHNPVLHIRRIENSRLIKAVKLLTKKFLKGELMVLICVCVFVCLSLYVHVLA